MKFLLLITFLMNSNPVMSQESDCALKLQDARDKFNTGQIEEIPSLLEDCLKSGFSREDRIQAFKLLINSYLFDDNLALSEQYMLEFLTKYPEYEPVATDPVEFVNLKNEFDNDPRSSIGFAGGLNFSLIRVSEAFGTGAKSGLEKGLEGNGVYKSSGSGFQAGIVYNYYINPKLEVGIDPMIIQNTFEFEQRPTSFLHLEYSENQLRVDLPVTLIYSFETSGKMAPYFRLGIKTSYLISSTAKSDSKLSYINTGQLNFEDITGQEQDIDIYRSVNNYWAIFGGGIRYKIPRAYFFLDIRYNLGLANQVKSNSRNIGLNENLFTYFYRDDNFYLDDISVSFGVSKTIFKPRRK